ncbi:MAG: HD-GYP domain-containing protein [Desulfamplus sp.]|nr:HD-GYP domain-containing protein [Desulfamplus sp.]
MRFSRSESVTSSNNQYFTQFDKYGEDIFMSINAIHQFAESLGNAIDAKDPYTKRHSLEVAEVSRILAFHLGLDSEDVNIVHIAGHLHDIGKIGVPDSILNKQGRLNNDEWNAIRRHPQIGAAILYPVQAIESSGICEIVLHHHERYDGNGYPNKLKAESIPIGARIIAVADSLSAMTGCRSYRLSMAFNDAVDEIIRCSGSQFDPKIVNVLSDNKYEVKEVLSSLIGEENMNTSFEIESRISNGNLHLYPKGDFDGSSACELLNFIHDRYSGKGKVFIDTNHLHRLCSFGCDTFRCGLNSSLLPPDRIFFKGKNGFEIAPNGSRVIVASENKKDEHQNSIHKDREHKCSGNCKNCKCSHKREKNNL